MKSSATADELLSSTRRQIQLIQQQSGLGRVALGLPQYDRQVWRLGQGRLDAIRSSQVYRTSIKRELRPDVFLATQLYDHGGHTALIGDFVEALNSGDEYGPRPHLILTNIWRQNNQLIPEPIRSRTRVLPENIHIMPGESLGESLDQLIAKSLDLQPRRLFLFHHPEDPLAVAVAQPAIAAERFLVHHADGTPTLGLHVPGVRVIELNPFAAAIARTHRLCADLLLLTAPDPGPRPHGFCTRGRLVTATCGGAHKYEMDYLYTYAEAVTVILQATGGTHVHIGPLSSETLATISVALRRAGLDKEAFIHRPWVRSLPEALWEYRCDVYFASFPIDGARTYVEVAASATPYLAHGGLRTRTVGNWAIGPRFTGVWNTLDELARALRSLRDLTALEEGSRLIRKSYDDLHRPEVFRQTLRSILAGEGGIRDPDEPIRDQWAVGSLVRSLENAFVAHEGMVVQRLDQFAADGLAVSQEWKTAVGRMDETLRSVTKALQQNASDLEDLKHRLDKIVADGQRRRAWWRLLGLLPRPWR